MRAAEADRLARLLARHGVSGDVAARLQVYLTLVYRWRGSLDILGKVSRDELVDVHVAETLAALPWLPGSGSLLDIGSGVGVPAIPLLVASPGLRGVLLEPRERRWAFLREVVRTLQLEARVVREDVASHGTGGYDVVTVKGVAPEAWWSKVPRLLAADGVLAWWTGEEKALRWQHLAEGGRVILSPLPSRGRSHLLVWRRCST